MLNLYSIAFSLPPIHSLRVIHEILPREIKKRNLQLCLNNTVYMESNNLLYRNLDPLQCKVHIFPTLKSLEHYFPCYLMFQRLYPLWIMLHHSIDIVQINYRYYSLKASLKHQGTENISTALLLYP